MRGRRWIGAVAIVALLACAGVAPAAAAVITVQAGQSIPNCIAFGCPGFYDPYMGYVYRNVAPFAVAPGDTIAFDTWQLNDYPLSFNIALAQAAANGSNVPDAGGFTQIVANGTAASPYGDTITGNFDLAYTVTAAYAFAGGGLIIRLNPTGATTGDFTGHYNLVGSGTPSTYHVSRFYSDTDGLYPWNGVDTNAIADFRVTTGAAVPAPLSLVLVAAGALAAASRARPTTRTARPSRAPRRSA